MSAELSLSVVLPVHNAQFTVAQRIAALLDIVPELTGNFEILVIDDGSDDQTMEVAHEIARIYPQVSVVKHPRRRGQSGVVQTALSRTMGDILLIQDEHAPIDGSKFHRLWSLRGSDQLRRPVTRLGTSLRLSNRLAAWGLRLEESSAKGPSHGLQMIRRPDRPISTKKISPLSGFTRVDDARSASSLSVQLTDFGATWLKSSC